MAASGLETFERTMQSSTIWVDETCDALGWTDRRHGYHALRVGLHALRDHLPMTISVHLAAQFPALIRGMYYEGWNPEHVPLRERGRDEFLARINEAFALDVEASGLQIIQAVMRVLSQHLSPGEVQKLQHCLPAGIRELWPRLEPAGEA